MSVDHQQISNGESMAKTLAPIVLNTNLQTINPNSEIFDYLGFTNTSPADVQVFVQDSAGNQVVMGKTIPANDLLEITFDRGFRFVGLKAKASTAGVITVWPRIRTWSDAASDYV